MAGSDHVVYRLRADCIRRNHAVAQPGNKNRCGRGGFRQQPAQQRAERTAGAGEGILFAADERIQLQGQVPPARLTDLARGAFGQDIHFVYGKAFDRVFGLPDLTHVGCLVHIFNRFNRKVGAERHFHHSFFGVFCSATDFLYKNM